MKRSWLPPLAAIPLATWLRLLPLGALALAACSDETTTPSQAPSRPAARPAYTIAAGSGPTGAIFTTMPDGGVVNANVQYQQKIEVYLDGGPGPHAPATAAGLDDGKYVFQITDPSGKYLLSQDPAMCRVVEVTGGVIRRLVPATELGFANNGYKVGNTTYPCAVEDNPPNPTNPGVAGATGRHDTNVDRDHGPPAIVVQMMPFGTTPNPGGVYKAWVSTLDAYVAKGGKLNDVPSAVRGRDAQPCPDFCAVADPGFGPPRNLQKTDNFKVKGVPPTLSVDKYTDVNANGMLDADDTKLPGWKVTVTETLYDNSQITNVYYTPVSANVAPNSSVQVCEDTPASWYLSFAYRDGVPVLPPATCITIPVGTANVALIFGNYQNATKSGYKFHDLNANGGWGAGEPGLNGWTIQAWRDGVKVDEQTTADRNGQPGYYEFSLKPGSYTIKEDCSNQTGTWYQTVPTPDGSQTCGSGTYSITLTSGQVETNNNFGNYQLTSVSGYKVNDLDGSGTRNGSEAGIEGWEVHLSGTTGAGASLHRHTLTDATGKFAFTAVPPGTYVLCESARSGWVQTYPTSGPDCTTHAAGSGTPPGVGAGTGYGYNLTLKSGDNLTVGFDFLNRATQGCTPGFWQGGFGIDLWNTVNDPQWGPPRITNGGTNPFVQSTSFNAFFKPAWEVDGMSMLDIVGTGGTSINAQKTARDVIAAYLNRAAGLAYPYGLTDIVSMWNDANVTVAAGTTTADRESRLLALHTLLDAANNLHNAPLCQ